MPKPLPNPRKSYEHKEQTMNEPVGVVCEFEGTLVGTLFEQLPNGTKLYTHPVKELTDEEIEECYCNTIYQGEFDRNVFARAILRKARKK